MRDGGTNRSFDSPVSIVTKIARLGSVYHETMMADLFETGATSLGDGITLLHRYVSTAEALVPIERVIQAAPLRHMRTPGGKRMSVAMTNCGQFGWVTDRRGYRYSRFDPESNRPWPTMPKRLNTLAHRAAADAGFPSFAPDVCLINRYEPGARLGLHQDRDERDFSQPIVSVSLGLPAIFLIGGLTRRGGARRIQLADGDVIVFGGPSRLIYHAIKPVEPGEHPLLRTCRINLTFRKAS